MKKQRRTIGSVLKISLEDGTHSYAQVLDKAEIVVFKIKTVKEHELEDILKKDVLFIIAVYNDAITSGRWVKVGKAALEERFQELPLMFIQDHHNPFCVRIYNPNTGEIISATKEKCSGLERAAVWSAEQVESRIIDYFNNKENIWVKQLELK